MPINIYMQLAINIMKHNYILYTMKYVYTAIYVLNKYMGNGVHISTTAGINKGHICRSKGSVHTHNNQLIVT